MGRIRNRNPFDASDWTGQIEITPDDVVPVAAGSSTQILTADAQRLWILFTYATGVGQVWVWPFQQTGPYGITTPGGGQSFLVHNASYPSLVQMPWYAYAQGGVVNLHIIIGTTVSRLRG